MVPNLVQSLINKCFIISYGKIRLNLKSKRALVVENTLGPSAVTHCNRNTTTNYHVVEVTFRSHYSAYHLFSNTTRLSSSLFNGGKIMSYSKFSLAHKSENVYNLSDILILNHDVRTYFTGPNKILHFAGSGHRMILKLWGGNLLSRDP